MEEKALPDKQRVAGGSGGASSEGSTPQATLSSQVVVGSSTEKPMTSLGSHKAHKRFSMMCFKYL